MRRLALLVALALLAAPLAAGAQSPEGRRIGLLTLTAPASTLRHTMFRQALQEPGYVEGKNIVIEFRSAAGRPDRLPTLAAELVRLKVDVIVTAGEPAIRAAKSATSTIPIVMAVVGDPVAAGFVASLAKPGGNLTGSTNLASGLARKRLELLREAVPHASRVAVLRYPVSLLDSLYWRETQQAAQVLGVTLQSVEVRDARELAAAFAAMKRERVGALVVFPDSFFFEHQARLAELALKHAVPAMHDAREFVEAGSLLAYGPSITALWRRAAVYVDKILKGARPGDLPIEQPTKFELAVNLKTAKVLGLTIPSSVLARADELIQ